MRPLPPLSAIVVVFVWLAVPASVAASGALPPYWQTDIATDETPECLDVSTRDDRDYFLEVVNSCEETSEVTVEVLECSGVECDKPEKTITCGDGRDASCRPNHFVEFWREDLGIDYEAYDEGHEATVTFGWGTDREEGVIELDLTRTDEPKFRLGTACGGCATGVGGGGDTPVGGHFLLLACGLLALRE